MKAAGRHSPPVTWRERPLGGPASTGNRKYNWCMNVPDEAEPKDEPRFSNPYYRGKQGL
jgi:hypothetical protein